MAELTIEEARKIYNESDSLKSLMLTKFSKEELETPVVTQEEFNKTFLKLLEKCIKTVYFDEHGHKSSVPTSWMELMADENDRDWILDIKYTGENKHFWVSYWRVWQIFKDKYNLPDKEIQRLMKNMMGILFGIYDITPKTGQIITEKDENSFRIG